MRICCTNTGDDDFRTGIDQRVGWTTQSCPGKRGIDPVGFCYVAAFFDLSFTYACQ